MKKIAIIPARGNSKRIPRKNIKLFLGKPIIAYSIETAINSKLFDEVMVSTEDSEIAKVALTYNAKVPFLRSERASSDFATTFDVIEEVLEKYKNIGTTYDYTCCIYACAPFVSPQKLKEGFDILIKDRFDSLFPIMPFSSPIQRALRVSEMQKTSFFYPEYALLRSQDLEKSYHDAGQFYWMNTQICLEKEEIMTNNTGSILLSELEGQDIDNEIDWQLAELKYGLLQSIK